MKIQFLIASLFIVAITTTNAQEKKSAKSNAGIKGGYNLASVQFDGNGETDQRHSFHVGLYGEEFLNESVSIQPELLYSQQGYVIRNSSGTLTQKLNYINLPVMLKLYPSDNFFFEAGPQIGLAISHKEEFNSGFDLFNSSEEFVPNNFDFGVNLGTGLKTDSGVTFAVRYHIGMGDLYESEKAKNRVWQFSIGFDL